MSARGCIQDNLLFYQIIKLIYVLKNLDSRLYFSPIFQIY